MSTSGGSSPSSASSSSSKVVQQPACPAHPSVDVEVVIPGNPTSNGDDKITLGEGAIWDIVNKRLLFVDILGKRVHMYYPDTNKHEQMDLPSYVGTVVPTNRPDLLLVALQNGIHTISTSTKDVIPFGIDPESDKRENRWNDGKCDPRGRLWAGTMGHLERDQDKGGGALYRIDGDATVTRIMDQVTVSNGLCWSLDGKYFYYIDTPTQRVEQFDYDGENATISNRQTLLNIPSEIGHPDGMTIDSQGNLWIALWGGGAITQWDVQSRSCIRTIHLPVSFVSSIAFGGPEMTDLYVTTASANGHIQANVRKEPLAGSLFVVRNIGVKGVPQPPFQIAPSLRK